VWGATSDQLTAGSRAYSLDIPETQAEQAIKTLSRVTGYPVIFQSADVIDIKTNPLKGRYTINQALTALFENTILSARLTQRGVITISRNTNNSEENSKVDNKKNILAVLIGIFVGASGAQQALAQEQDTNKSERVLEEVTVTAQKRSESAQDVPIAMSAFSAKGLSDMGVSNTQDLQMVTPSFVFSNTSVVAQPYLRGVGSRLTFSGLDPSVATYVGERYVPRASGNIFELGPDVERVEVLKGPQGTLFGRNVTGGAVRVIKKDVDDEFGGEVKATYGNYDAKILQGTVNVPVSEDFGFRLSAQKHLRDGYQTNIVRDIYPDAADEPNNRDLSSVNAKFRWDISDKSTAKLSLDYWKQNDYANQFARALPPYELQVGVAQGFEYATSADEVATQISGKTDGEEFGGELYLDYSFETFDLVSVTTYTDFQVNFGGEVDGTAAPLLDINNRGNLDKSETITQEFRLVSTTEGPLEWIVGINYYQDRHTSEVAFSEKSPVAPNVSNGYQTTETDAQAAFGQLGWTFSEQWKVIVGGRYTTEEKEVTFGRSKRGFNVPMLVGSITDEEDWSEFTPKVTLEYRWNDDAFAYLSYARGFKSGGFNYPVRGTEPLDPEILDMIELGMKGDYFDDALRINTALFYYEYSDLQVTRAADTSSGGATNVTENAADASLYGLEGDITWLPTNQLQITVGFTLLDTEYDEYLAAAKQFNRTPGGVPAPGVRDVAFNANGHDLLRASDFAGYVNLQYEFIVTGGYMPVSLMYSYKDDFYFDFVADPLMENLKQDGYGLLNAKVAFEPDHDRWSIALWGKNLTDEEYFADSVANVSGHRVLYAPPRTYGVDFGFKF